MARLGRWCRYRRRYSRLIRGRLAAGYAVTADREAKFRAEARRAAGY